MAGFYSGARQHCAGAPLAWYVTALHTLATAEFTTLRMRLLKIAARITETATRVRVAFAAACPEAELFRGVARSLQPAGP